MVMDIQDIWAFMGMEILEEEDMEVMVMVKVIIKVKVTVAMAIQVMAAMVTLETEFIIHTVLAMPETVGLMDQVINGEDTTTMNLGNSDNSAHASTHD
jgi:hypothetical protein